MMDRCGKILVRGDGLIISPLRGLMTFWFTTGYHVVIPSGLKKMAVKINHENIEAMNLQTTHLTIKYSSDGHNRQPNPV